jgi:MSHA biogenesis protein MshO
VRDRGYTLVELVVTIAVAAVVVSMMAMFVVGPVRAYEAQARRAVLVDTADGALRAIARDVRGALPNSVRVTTVGGRVALELLATVDGARYRDGALGDPDDDLDLSRPDAAFSTATPFTRVALPFDSSRNYLAIYNVGVPGADAYEGANVVTPAGTRIRIAAGASPGSQRVTLTPAARFAWGSPGKRVYLVEGPVTWLCDPGTRTLTRWSGYPLRAAQATTAADLQAAGAVAGRVADALAGCTIDYAPGTPERAGLVTLTLRLEQDGERVELLHQIHLPNAP